MKLKLDYKEIYSIVQELNTVLDKNKIFTKDLTIEIMKKMIISNLTKNDTIKLIKELEETPIKEWVL